MEEGGIVHKCNCFPPCEDVSYDVSYSLSKWPSAGYEGDTSYTGIFRIVNFNERFNRPETMGKYESLNRYFNETKFRERAERMRNFARLNVYIADSNVVKTEESPDYTGSDVISDIGGQLGLWVGISVITLAEVFALVCDICRYLLSLCKNHHDDLRCEKSSTENNVMTQHPFYASVQATDEESDSNYDYTARPNRPIYSTGHKPRKPKKQTSVTPIKNTNDQWARKFVDHNSKEPSIPNVHNCYSEV